MSREQNVHVVDDDRDVHRRRCRLDLDDLAGFAGFFDREVRGREAGDGHVLVVEHADVDRACAGRRLRRGPRRWNEETGEQHRRGTASAQGHDGEPRPRV